MTTTIGTTLVALYVVGSMAYAYKYRGQARWESLTEYLRKGWPLFTPLNCFLYLFTERRARPAIMDLNEFPELDPIRDNWETIRDEGKKLLEARYFEQTTDPNSAAYFDIGFRTFYKYGWSKFYLFWYGYTHNSALKLCPKTVEILQKVPSVNGAMFSYLPPGGQLTRHLDPIACSLRYHLALMTPNSEKCRINVDGQSYAWRDGEGMMFDETFLHFVNNDTDQGRLILMCDVERPTALPGRLFNSIYKSLAKLSVVPNLEGDKRGFANIVFSTLSPLLKKSKELKSRNRSAYLLLKYSVNTTLILIVVALVAGIFSLFS